MRICYHCGWKILDNDLSIVVINDKYYFHTACFNDIDRNTIILDDQIFKKY